VDDEAWVRATLERGGWPVDEDALPYLVLVQAGIRRQLDALATSEPPEVDLDPSRAPR
jgi:hypothetical protein